VSALTRALLEDLSEEDLDRLAEILTPRIAAKLDRTTDDGWLRGADAIAAHIGAPKSRVYALQSAGRIPVCKDGSALVARKSDLDAWVRSGGGKRP
jgi:hypothetical protein